MLDISLYNGYTVSTALVWQINMVVGINMVLRNIWCKKTFYLFSSKSSFVFNILQKIDQIMSFIYKVTKTNVLYHVYLAHAL